MKKVLLFLMIVVFVVSCKDNNLDVVSLSASSDSIIMKSDVETSPMFDWENNSYIKLFKSDNDIVLPWYNGATTQIDNSILEDYKSRDGWQLVYNFCTPTKSGKLDVNKPYLIFYNIFTGQLRGFVYMNKDVTGANESFWQISFNKDTKLTNDFDSLLNANDVSSNSKVQYAENITRTPSKSLSRGWNCFEIDLANYDPCISEECLSMNLDTYNMINLNFESHGTINLSTEGTVVSISSSSSLPTFAQKGVSALGSYLGKKAKNVLENKILNSKKASRSILGLGVAALVENGVTALANKLFAKKTSSTDSSFIKLTSTGTINQNAQILGFTQPNLSSLSNLMVPGSKQANNSILIPLYNKPLGVFCIKETPRIVVKRHYLDLIKVENGSEPVHGGAANNNLYELYSYYSIGLDKDLDVLLNPNVLENIDKYSVSVSFVGDQIKEYLYKKDDNGFELGTIGSKVYGTTFVSNTSIDYWEKGKTTYYIPSKDYSYYYEKLMKAIKPKIPKNLAVKVEVTLYPKSSYNVAPIVLVRTLKCNIDSMLENA